MNPYAPTRRELLRGLVGSAALLGFQAAAGCSRSSTANRVVLYTSVDDEVLRPIIAAFERASGLSVGLVTDTEATKTTGLVQRLLDEAPVPRADVWWSSEPSGTARLARERVLEPLSADLIPDAWPERLIGKGRSWVGFAQRARVIAFSATRVGSAEIPVRLSELTSSKWNDRVGMARPQFGTTRTHMAAIAARAGVEELRKWLTSMKSRGLRLYDGNASVVKAIAQAEIDVGLTDSDDVWAARRNGWAVDSTYESVDDPPVAVSGSGPASRPVPRSGLVSVGPLLLPNTLARVRGGPNAASALTLLKYLLSADTERALAASDSRNIPVHPGVAAEFESLRVPSASPVNFDDVELAVDGAMSVCREVLG